jgi:glycyl-tRNA synthetase (class II)
MDCKECKARWRADKLIDNKIEAGETEPENYA